MAEHDFTDRDPLSVAKQKAKQDISYVQDYLQPMQSIRKHPTA
jgi:hypothetical protein